MIIVKSEDKADLVLTDDQTKILIRAVQEFAKQSDQNTKEECTELYEILFESFG